jgi:hypothetical protein
MPFEMDCVSHAPSSIVAVWAASSSFVQATVSPALMETVAGENAKSRMVTVSAALVPAVAVAQPPPPGTVEGSAEAALDGALDGDDDAPPPQAATMRAVTATPAAIRDRRTLGLLAVAVGPVGRRHDCLAPRYAVRRSGGFTAIVPA